MNANRRIPTRSPNTNKMRRKKNGPAKRYKLNVQELASLNEKLIWHSNLIQFSFFHCVLCVRHFFLFASTTVVVCMYLCILFLCVVIVINLPSIDLAYGWFLNNFIPFFLFFFCCYSSITVCYAYADDDGWWYWLALFYFSSLSFFLSLFTLPWSTNVFDMPVPAVWPVLRDNKWKYVNININYSQNHRWLSGLIER